MADVTKAPSGMTGLETSCYLLGLTYLVEAGHLSLIELLKLMTSIHLIFMGSMPVIWLKMDQQ